MRSISCHECRRHLAAYAARELPAGERQRIARHLDGCDACYAELKAQRALTQQLQQTLPQLAALPPPAFQTVWAGVRQPPLRLGAPVFVRYGLAVMAFCLVMLLPFSFRQNVGTLSAALAQPAPLAAVILPRSTETLHPTEALIHIVSQTPQPIIRQEPAPALAADTER